MMTETLVRATRGGRRLAGILVLLVAPLAGCGYTLVGRGTNLPPDIRTVYLETFDNQTNKVQVEQLITQAVADELVTRQRFSIASDTQGADAMISGTLIAAGLTPVTFDPSGRATEYEVAIVAKVQFKRLDAKSTVIWSSDRYMFREAYPVAVGATGFFDLENTALEEASKKFAETMVSDLLEGF